MEMQWHDLIIHLADSHPSARPLQGATCRYSHRWKIEDIPFYAFLILQGSEAFESGDPHLIDSASLSMPIAGERQEAIESQARDLTKVSDPPSPVLFRFSVIGKEHVLTQRGGEPAHPQARVLPRLSRSMRPDQG